ncbi:energy transducer TonB [Polaromonas sp. CG_9.11]|uniref:energy transducer TonB n=1 Tax=Polaromonas sp. CG_9.11 TaxID=2787730 RepID=UPI0018CB6D65|nr:energy transducer TonB [Polaromonas sp. CG_9.11]MBG6074459.1 protein TonB [Polaromonas sp. CG_9.11]
MNATFSGLPYDPPKPPSCLSRHAVIALVVVALHVGLIWTLQTGLLLRMAELIVPVEVLAELIELPQPQPEPASPAPPAPPTLPKRPVTPAPAVQKKTVPKPVIRPQAQPLVTADPTPAPNAPAGSLTPAPAFTPAPVAEAPAGPAAPGGPPASPSIQLPSSNADYLQNPKPAYPALSKRLGEQGKVVIRVLIGADGTPQKAELRQSSGYERLDQAALNTVLKWRYVPGKRGGVAEDMWFNVPINFVLE